MTDERRRGDDHLSGKMDELLAGVNEMKTALFGPEYDPKMGFIYRTEARLATQEHKVETLERAHWKQTGIVAGILGALQFAWNYISGGGKTH